MKNKILTISIVFILLSFIFINNVFARDINIDLSSISYVQYGYVIYECNDGNIYLACSPDSAHNLTGYINNHIVYSEKNTYSAGCAWYTVLYKINEDNTFTFICNQDPFDSSSYQVSKILYSDRDVYTEQKKSLFFLATPIPEPIPVTLAGVLETTNPMEIFKTLMKNVVISLLVFVVSYLALRKAWSFLRTQLKGS